MQSDDVTHDDIAAMALPVPLRARLRILGALGVYGSGRQQGVYGLVPFNAIAALPWRPLGFIANTNMHSNCVLSEHLAERAESP
jgi:hypothetical protein